MGNNPTVMRVVKQRKWKANSVVVVTGASSGIGKELAFQYSRRQCRLVLASRNVEELEKVATLCRAQGSEAIVVQTDVTIEEDCKNLIAKTIEEFGEIDILILNAGVGGHQPFEEVTESTVYHKMMDVNFFGYLNCTRFAFPHLQQSKGQIVVISSLSGEVGLPLRTAYCASKFAVTGFFEALRMEQEKGNVAITMVCPPSVATPLREHSLVAVGSSKEKETKRMPVEKCASMIVEAADRRARKLYFPTKAYLAVYIRPFFPDFVDPLLKRASKL
eukprot:GILJ01006669.1.p1 GENE.GILJ01006669.1~~GILJ01006669.1.p1  ORF type:complete len:275 (+),score=33.51 GILJ01006669.1:95-919(+)